MTPPNYPADKLTQLALVLATTSNAIAAYAQYFEGRENGVPGTERPTHERMALEAHESLVQAHLITREALEKLRADFEHQLMVWREDVLKQTDELFRLGTPHRPVPPAVPFQPPKWAESPEDEQVTLAATRAAAEALGEA